MSPLPRISTFILSFTLCTTVVSAQRATLSSTENAMVQAINAESPAALALLERLVNINSGTMNIPGVRAVKDVLSPQIEALGFTVKWIPMETLTARAGQLLAEHPCPAGAGECGKRLLLVGHMDTVFEPDSKFQKFAIVPGTDGKVASGPGVVDTKGGLVIMLSALKAMKAAGALEATEITIVLSGDEERVAEPTSISRRDLIAAAKRSDVALEFEFATRIDGKDTARIARRSANRWQLETTGVSGHSSLIFNDTFGHGAIHELTRILDGFRSQLPERGLTFSVGLLLGGTTVELNDTVTGGTVTGKTNVIPPTAVAIGDIRTLDNAQRDRVVTKMLSIVKAHLPKTNATLTLDEGYPAMPETEGSRALFRQLNDVNASAGLPAMTLADVMTGGAGDIAFAAPYVPGLVGVGALGSGAHAETETVYLDSLPTQAKRMALLMYRLSKN